MIDDRVVDVGAACLGVAARCEDLEDSAAKVHQCNIVGSSSEAEDHDFHLLVRLVQAIGKACCGGLVDYPIHFEACDLTRILCCLPLVVVEVRGNSDDNLLYRSSSLFPRTSTIFFLRQQRPPRFTLFPSRRCPACCSP